MNLAFKTEMAHFFFKNLVQKYIIFTIEISWYYEWKNGIYWDEFNRYVATLFEIQMILLQEPSKMLQLYSNTMLPCSIKYSIFYDKEVIILQIAN